MRVLTRRNLTLMFAAFVVGIVAGVWAAREPTIALTRDTLVDARKRSTGANVAAYELDYDMHGSAYHVVYRSGVVEHVIVNGQQPISGDWRTYSVEGMFDILALELDNIADAYGRHGDSVLLRVRFNPNLGYVERYLRGGGGIGKGATIENVRFRELP